MIRFGKCVNDMRGFQNGKSVADSTERKVFMGKEIKNLRKRLIGIIAVLMAGLIVAVLPVDSVFTGDIIYARADEDEAVEAAEDADGEKEAGEDEKKDSQKKSEKDGKEDSIKS